MASRNEVTQAFILGAGLGTRLRPMTNLLPTPLMPIFQDFYLGQVCAWIETR
ncbi:MAG: sugar phosphate nucleotidyltransferase [Akkermansia sp.]